MKHLTVLISLLIIFALNGKIFGQLENRHQSVLSYSFDEALVYITNEFATDTASRFIPEYFQPPYKDRTIQVYGPSLDLKITSVRSGEGFAAMSKASITSISGNVRDTTGKKQTLFDMRWLQVRIERNGRLLHDWQNVQDIRNIKLAAGATDQPDFSIFSDTLDPEEHLKLSFRNTLLRDTLISFFFERHTTPLQPYMPMWKQDSAAGTTHAMFMRTQLRQEKTVMDTLNTFYRYWPNRYSGRLKNEHFFPTSKIAMYFRKPSPDYPDNSVEYALLTGKTKDTSWTVTGHLLILPQLETGKHYRMLVRYRENPSMIQVHTFYTDPAWYQTRQFYAAIIASLVILTLIFFLFRNRVGLRKEKKKGRALKNNLQSIRAQLNPHFIFNALSSIQSLINDKNIEAANHYLSEFSDLLRQALRNSDKEMIPLQQELQLLATYLSLEQLRFPFTYTLHVDESIDESLVEFPSLLLQPVIENAIRHAAGPLAEKGRLEISFRAVKNDLLVSVNDNGSGYNPDIIQEEGHGIRLTTERILLLNQLLHPRYIRLEINSTKSGTAVHLNFRNWLQV